MSKFAEECRAHLLVWYLLASEGRWLHLRLLRRKVLLPRAPYVMVMPKWFPSWAWFGDFSLNKNRSLQLSVVFSTFSNYPSHLLFWSILVCLSHFCPGIWHRSSKVLALLLATAATVGAAITAIPSAAHVRRWRIVQGVNTSAAAVWTVLGALVIFLIYMLLDALYASLATWIALIVQAVCSSEL